TQYTTTSALWKLDQMSCMLGLGSDKNSALTIGQITAPVNDMTAFKADSGGGNFNGMTLRSGVNDGFGGTADVAGLINKKVALVMPGGQYLHLTLLLQRQRLILRLYSGTGQQQ